MGIEQEELPFYPEKLYGGTPPHEKTPTSEAAAHSVKISSESWRGKILGLIQASGIAGVTDDQIEGWFQIRHQTASARRRELVLLGKVKDSGRTRTTSSGRQATVWIAP